MPARKCAVALSARDPWSDASTQFDLPYVDFVASCTISRVHLSQNPLQRSNFQPRRVSAIVTGAVPLEVENRIDSQHGLPAFAAVLFETRGSAGARERAGWTQRVGRRIARIVVGITRDRTVRRGQLVFGAHFRPNFERVAHPVRITQIEF